MTAAFNVYQDLEINIDDLLGPDRTLTDHEFRHCHLTIPGPMLAGSAESDHPKAWRAIRCGFIDNVMVSAPDFEPTVEAPFMIMKDDPTIPVTGNIIKRGATT